MDNLAFDVALGYLQRGDAFWTQFMSVCVGHGHEKYPHVRMRLPLLQR
jgi:hypothetical protein